MGNDLDKDAKKEKDIAGRLEAMRRKLEKVQGRGGDAKEAEQLQAKIAKVEGHLEAADRELDAD